MSLVIVFCARIFLKANQAWSSIFENYKYYGFKNIISQKNFNRFLLVNRLLIILIIVEIITTVIHHFSEISYDQLPWHNLRTFFLIHSIILQLTVSYDLKRMLILAGILLENVKVNFCSRTKKN